LSDRPLPLPGGTADTDVSCTVLCGPPEGSGWKILPESWECSPGWVREDGRALALKSWHAPSELMAARLRWMLPFASALQGKVVLHASAVARGASVVAFVAESGVGKSTFAGHLVRRGWSLVADDLLPCRNRGGRIVVPRGGRDLALAGLYFPERVPPFRTPAISRLSAPECLTFLMRNGFGEFADPRNWAAQFELYGEIALRSPAMRLEIPDSLARLPQAVLAWEAHATELFL
jgi:hypothetical protein